MFIGKRTTLSLSLLGLLSALSSSVQADITAGKYTFVAPNCLTKTLSAKHNVLSQIDNVTLLKTDEAGLNQLIAAKEHQKLVCGGFINVTDAWNTYQQTKSISHDAKSFLQHYTTTPAATLSRAKTAYAVNYPKQVNELMGQLNSDEMWTNLTTLSSFTDRYANSDNGVKAANWFKENIEKLAAQYGRKDVTIQLINTGSSYKQPSVVVKVGSSNEPAVVIGGHMDTLQGFFSNMPGADDDGTGSVTVLQVAKTLLASNMQFKRPIYFIWYSAEEEGLVGSQHVVAAFKKQNIPVAQVLHMDMTGYANQNDPTLWLIKDYTNPDLTTYLETLIKTYVKKPVKYTKCGYACSDHATWTQNGFTSAIAFESEFGKDDPYIHTAQDTMGVLSLSHMTDYAKLATAFMVELAEPVA
jgi:leucyl aminopeptidase